ncbi:hypothetical protein CEXT_132911 [Caerostris extrusa]|uniref:Uncharacterized protein n=1 Tax=Caerostris extrusa TaxID=172846 RepID=A0AAV4NPT5_CAEEX|nr:hypothetical protein CEXT_132911 [Caerostris extrusa]
MTKQRQHLGTPQWAVVSLPWLVDCPHIGNCLVTTLKTTPEEYMPGKHENHLSVQNNIRKELFGHMIFHINGLLSPALFKNKMERKEYRRCKVTLTFNVDSEVALKLIT